MYNTHYRFKIMVVVCYRRCFALSRRQEQTFRFFIWKEQMRCEVANKSGNQVSSMET